MSAATCLYCGVEVAVVASDRTGAVSVVDGMPDKTGIAFVDFRNGTFSLPRDSERLRGLMHRFHECGYERIVQVRPGVRK